MRHAINTKSRVTLAIVLILLATPSYALYKGFAKGDSLISVQDLKTLMDTHQGDLLIVAVAETELYRTGHIPGAQRVWRNDYGAVKGMDYPYDGMIARKTDFRAFARILGVNDDTTVVVYDHKFDATRLWWAFYLYGKVDVRVLDGGFRAWKAAGLPIETKTPPSRRTGRFSGRDPQKNWSVDADYIKRGASEHQIQLWDTRDQNEWLGQVVQAGATRKGRIPSAKLLSWNSVHTATGEFATASQLTQLIRSYNLDKGKEQVFYCHSGIRSTQVIFAFYLLGWPVEKLHNFDGAWIAWTHNPGNPVVCEACGP